MTERIACPGLRQMHPELTQEEAEQCLDDVQALKDQGQLFSPDTFAPMAGAFKARSGNVVKALCLHVAHTCNLNCAYCFASQGRYHGQRAIMSFEVGKQPWISWWPTPAPGEIWRWTFLAVSP